MNYERFKRTKKIIDLYESTVNKSDTLHDCFCDWFFDPYDRDEKDLTMYLLFERTFDTSAEPVCEEITEERFDILVKEYNNYRPENMELFIRKKPQKRDNPKNIR